MSKDWVDAELNCKVGETVSAINLNTGEETRLEKTEDQPFMASSPSIMDNAMWNYIICDADGNVYAVQSIDLDFD